MSVKKLIVAAIVIPSVAFSAFSAIGPLGASAQSQQACDTVTLVSGAGAEVAGYTQTDPAGAAAALQAGAYSGGSFSAAIATETVIPPWVDPAADANFSGSGAVWISSDSSWPGGTDNEEGSATSSQWRLFRDSFMLPAGVTVSSSVVYFAADNAVEVYLNGSTTSVASTGDVYGAVSDTSPQNFASVSSTSFTPIAGENTLSFVVRNWPGDTDTNPTGLLYKVAVNYCGSSGELHVDNITMAKATGTADGTFEDGWRYVFDVTVPNDEPNFAMKFADWVSGSDVNDVIPVANNMRISSDQASNDGAAVPLTAADTYSSPALVINEDLDTGRAGMQIQVVVEVSIPEGTDNGNYTTTYSIRTLPNQST